MKGLWANKGIKLGNKKKKTLSAEGFPLLTSLVTLDRIAEELTGNDTKILNKVSIDPLAECGT